MKKRILKSGKAVCAAAMTAVLALSIPAVSGAEGVGGESANENACKNEKGSAAGTAPEFEISYNRAYRLVPDEDASPENDVYGAVPAAGYTAYYGADIVVRFSIKEGKAEEWEESGADSTPGTFELKINEGMDDLPDIEWSYDEEAGAYVGEFALSKEGDYQIEIAYMDAEGNAMAAGENVEGYGTEQAVDESGIYRSAKMVIDKSMPDNAQIPGAADGEGRADETDCAEGAGREGGEGEDSLSLDGKLLLSALAESEDSECAGANIETFRILKDFKAMADVTAQTAESDCGTSFEGVTSQTGEGRESESGDNTADAADLSAVSEAEDTIAVPLTDAAGGTAEDESTEDAEESAIDRTAPRLTVSYDNENAKGGIYFNAPRTALIDIYERNFDPSKIEISASRDGADISPDVSEWKSSGDHHTVEVRFLSDGEYSLEVSGTDAAGNPLSGYTAEPFTIDTEAPVIEIYNIENYSANNGEVRPKIRYFDAHLDAAESAVELSGYYNGNVQIDGESIATECDVRITLDDFEHKKERDDIYTLSVRACDLAGNVAQREIEFSVNRFGSVYTFDEATAALLGADGSYYTNEAQDITVIETNVDSLEFGEIIRDLNGELITLNEGEDYSAKESLSDSGAGWKQYVYTIDKSVFEDEGKYILTVNSKDRATNTNSTGSGRQGEKLEFVLDKTEPSIVVSGAEDGGEYRGSAREVTIDVEDNTGLSIVSVYVNGEEREYTADDMADGKIKIRYESGDRAQSLKVSAYDAAGNVTDKMRAGGEECLEIRFTLTSGIFGGLSHILSPGERSESGGESAAAAATAAAVAAALALAAAILPRRLSRHVNKRLAK